MRQTGEALCCEEKRQLMKTSATCAVRLPRMCLYALGLGFYWTWVALAFFSTPLYYADGGFSGYTLVWGSGTLTYALMLAFIVAAPKLFPAELFGGSVTMIISGLSMSAGSLLIILSNANAVGGLSSVGNFAGVIVFNGGSTFLILSWAKKFCELNASEVLTASCFSYIIMSCTHIVVTLCDPVVTSVLVIALPLLSSSMGVLDRVLNLPSSSEDRITTTGIQRQFRFKILLPLAVLFFYGICEEVLRNLFTTGSYTPLTVGLYYNIGGGVAGVLLLVITFVLKKRPSDFLSVTGLRGILVLMALAFLLGSMLRLPVPITYLLYSTGFHMLRVFAWVYVVQASQRGTLRIIPATAITQAVIALSATPIALLAEPVLAQAALDNADLGIITTGLLFFMIVLVSLALNPVDLETTWGTIPQTPTVSISAYDEKDLAFLVDDFGLTRREAEIALLLANGRSMPRIKDDLCVSLGTVQTHVNHIYRKMDVHSRQEFLDIVAQYSAL